jgi:hypothetical protein
MSVPLAEVRQVYELIQQIEGKINRLVSQRPEIERTKVESLQLNQLLMQTVGLMRQVGLADDLTTAIMRVQTMITALHAMNRAMTLVLAGSGPVGWLMLGISAVGLGLAITPPRDPTSYGTATSLSMASYQMEEQEAHEIL